MTAIHRPICISVINMKGGVGKTTVAALLSRHASRNDDLKVLAIDFDPQANLSQALMGDRSYRQFLSDHSPSIVEIFNRYQPPSGLASSPTSLDIDQVTKVVEPNLRIIPSRFDFSDHLIGSIRPDARILARIISQNFQDIDIIIVDCAPTESIFTQAAYHASRYVLVPVRPEYFATIGFPLLNDSLSRFRSDNRGHQIDVIGVVINNSAYHYSGNRGGPERERSIAEIRSEAQQNGWFVFENQIPFSRGFPKMMRGDYLYLGDAVLFEHFAREFFEKLHAIADTGGTQP